MSNTGHRAMHIATMRRLFIDYLAHEVKQYSRLVSSIAPAAREHVVNKHQLYQQ